MKTINLDINASRDYFVNESLKTLRTNVQFCGTDVKAIAVTSCKPNEGKSTISLELARSLAEVGKKVLFIDADMRKSVVVQKYADGMGIVGLSQYLSGQNSLEDVLYSTQVEGMDIIFAGQFPANPVELLSSSAFKALIDEQTKVYDYVLVDTPPLGVVIDCAVIANACDSAIMVIAAEKVSYRRAKVIKAQLEKSGVHILGVVLNRVKRGSLRYPKPYNSQNSKAYAKTSKKKSANEGSVSVAQVNLSDNKKDNAD